MKVKELSTIEVVKELQTIKRPRPADTYQIHSLLGLHFESTGRIKQLFNQLKRDKILTTYASYYPTGNELQIRFNDGMAVYTLKTSKELPVNLNVSTEVSINE